MKLELCESRDTCTTRLPSRVKMASVQNCKSGISKVISYEDENFLLNVIRWEIFYYYVIGFYFRFLLNLYLGIIIFILFMEFVLSWYCYRSIFIFKIVCHSSHLAYCASRSTRTFI